MNQDTAKEDIREAVATMRRGGIILYPTDTIWGLGCDATNAEAVARLFEIKHRPDAKSMLALVDSVAMLERYVDDIPDVAYELIEAAVNPLTIIYDHPRGIAPALLAPDGSMGFRITRERYSASLCRALRHPIVSTSANISGKPSPRNFSEITEQITGSVDYIAGYRRADTTPASPSGIIKISDGGVFKILR